VPEGDTIFRAAKTLHRVLAGDVVTRFESAIPALMRVEVDRGVTGRVVESVTSRGKHLLIAFSGDLFLHTHMRMNGTWHVYRPEERWRRPSRDFRVLIATARAVAVGFNIPVAEFLTRRDLARHARLGALGPDLLDPQFDRAEAVRRLQQRPSATVADALLDQRAVAGVGNVFKSEALFEARIFPFEQIDRLDAAALERLLDVARRQLRANAYPQPGWPGAGARRTTGSLHPDTNLWVYGRAGQRCRICGTTIKAAKTGLDARLTYWCPTCQADPGSSGGC
jgi:endonuclease-8